jgi:8-oxo-dGDP phosphatase
MGIPELPGTPEGRRADFVLKETSTLFAGRVFTLFDEVYESPTGERFDRQIVRNNGAVAVVALHEDQTVTLIRQFRPALRERILEIPAGLLDKPGEEMADGAARELREEVGLVAGRMELLGACAPAPGMTDERITIFLAQDLTFVGTEVDGPEEEDLEILRIPFAEALAMATSGQILDGKTQLGLLLTARRYGW